MAKNQHTNSFEGGLNQDSAPEIQKPNTYVDATNLRTVSVKGENGKLQNIESHTLFWALPDRVPRLDKFQLCWEVTGDNPILGVQVALVPEEGLAATLIENHTVSGDNLGAQITSHFNGFEFVDNDGHTYRLRVRPNGNQCVSVEVSCPRVDDELNPEGVQLVVGHFNESGVSATTTDQSIPETTDIMVVGMASQGDTLVVVTNGLPDGDANADTIGSVWKIDTAPGGVYPEEGVQPNVYQQLRYHGPLGLDNDHPIIDAHYVEVDDCTHLFTWTDNLNEPSTVEVSSLGLNLTPPKALRDRGLVDYCPYAEFVGYTTGKLRAGLWQYAVQLYTKSGNTTNYGPECYPIMVRYDNDQPYRDTDGKKLGEPGNLGVRLNVRNLDGQYDGFRVAALYSSQEDGTPESAEIVVEQEFGAVDVEVVHVEEGGLYGTLDVSEVTEPQPYITKAKRMDLVNQVKILANICEKAEIDIQVSSDVEAENVVDMNSNTVNLSDLSVDEEIPLSPEQNIYGNDRVTGSPAGSGLDFDNDFQDYKGPTAKAFQETFPHGERGRIGIEFFLGNLFRPAVLWVDDPQFPSQSTYTQAEPFAPFPANREPIIQATASAEDGTRQLGDREYTKWNLDARLRPLSLYLPDIDLGPIKDEIVGFRVMRADYDAELVAQGFILHGVTDRVTKQQADASYWQGYETASGEELPAPEERQGIDYWPNNDVWEGGDTRGMFVSVEPCSHTEDGFLWNFPPGKRDRDGISTTNFSLNENSIKEFSEDGEVKRLKNNPEWMWNEAFRQNVFFYSPDLDFVDEAVDLEGLTVEFLGELCEPEWNWRFWNQEGIYGTDGLNQQTVPAYPPPGDFNSPTTYPSVSVGRSLTLMENTFPTRRNFIKEWDLSDQGLNRSNRVVGAIVYLPVFANPNPWERYRLRTVDDYEYLEEGAYRKDLYGFPWNLYHGIAQSSGSYGHGKPGTGAFKKNYGIDAAVWSLLSLPSWSQNAAYARKGKCVLLRLDRPHYSVDTIGLRSDWAGNSWEMGTENRFMPRLFRTDWPVNPENDDWPSEDMNTKGGRLGTGIDRIASNLTIVNLRRRVEEPYGGTSKSALAATRYRITSHFQPVDDRHPGGVGGDPDRYDARVYGGGAYLTYYERIIQYPCVYAGLDGANGARDKPTSPILANMRMWYANPYYSYYMQADPGSDGGVQYGRKGTFADDADSVSRYQPQVTMIVPLLSWKNPLLRELRNEDSETQLSRDLDVFNDMEESGVSESIDQKSEPFHLFEGWNNLPSATIAQGAAVEKECDPCYPNLVRYSLRKNFGERSDSWVRFLALNYSEAPIEYGAINGIGQIFPQGGSNINVWQERAIGQFPFLEDQIVTADSGQPLEIGQATGMGTYRLTRENVGLQQAFPLHTYGNAAYWYDSATRTLYRYAQDGIVDLGTMRGMRAFFGGKPSRQFDQRALLGFADFLPDALATADAPMSSDEGGYQVYFDPKFSELYIACSYRETSQVGVPGPNGGWMLTYNETLNVFQSFHDWIADGFERLDGNRLLVLNNFGFAPYNRGIYLANSGGRNDYGRFMGNEERAETSVTFVFNPNPDILKQPASIHLGANQMWDRVDWKTLPQAMPDDLYIFLTDQEKAYFQGRGTRWQGAVPRIKSSLLVTNNDPQRPETTPSNFMSMSPLQGDLIRVSVRVSAQTLRTLHAVYTYYGLHRRFR